MASSMLFIFVATIWILMFRMTEEFQSSRTQVLQQLRKQLEYPKQLDAWDVDKDLCFVPPSPSMAITCEGNLITELKIAGDEIRKPKKFDGFAVPDMTMSSTFSIDSFVTTLSRLSGLRVLILVSLGIWGQVPDKIHRLESLEVLDLSSNFLYGSIPAKISTMEKLRTITLDGNYFNDTVPDWFGSLPNLTILSLQRNQISGAIPESLGRVRTLNELALSSNNLTGKIPDISGLTNLEVLDMRENDLGSQLPTMPNGLVTLLLNKNSFTGDIPLQFRELKQLRHLDLSFNFLEGTPPSELFSLPNISYLNLASNMLSGSLPRGIRCGSQLGFIDISSNRLTGELPSCLGSILNQSAVNFSNNCLNIKSQHQHRASFCPDTDRKGNGFKGKGMGLLVAVIAGGTLVLLLLFLGTIILCRKNCRRVMIKQCLQPRPVQANTTSISTEFLTNIKYISHAMKVGKQILPTYRVFSLEEIKDATKNFESSSYIGEGSMGKLYKGRLENGNLVAIRCLALFKRYSVRNLKLRIDLLAKLRHPHLVCLLGHCIDSAPDDSNVNRVFLIYEYIPNGNLRSHLYENSPEKVLKWFDRLSVLIGVVKAVHFLHTGVIPGFVNNRLKINNILLDEYLVAKLSDYGLYIIREEIEKYEAKTEGQRSQNKSSACETVMLEDDVFSVGLILLEALLGSATYEKQADFLKDLPMSSKVQDEWQRMIDPIILVTSSQDSLSLVVSIASKCLYENPTSRPSLEDVLWNLQYAAQVQATADGDQRSETASQA